jgi:uncharacterized protein YecT (DUF1311 family)
MVAGASAILLATTTGARAQPIDCSSAKELTGHLICDEPSLRNADAEMAQAFDKASTGASASQRTALIDEQRTWRRSLEEDYLHRVGSDAGTEGGIRWLRARMIARAKALETRADGGTFAFLVAGTPALEACASVLDKRRMTWSGRDVFDLDYFSLSLAPRTVVSPVSGGEFSFGETYFIDLLNTGHPQQVLSYGYENSNWSQMWWIVPASDREGKLIKELLDQGKEQELAAQLQREHSEGVQRGVFPSANASTHRQPAAPVLASRLLDTSATSIYSGGYTTSELARIGKTTYVVATAMNSRNGPTFALFMPHAPGRLEALCTFTAPSSQIKKTVKVSDPKGYCPETRDATGAGALEVNAPPNEKTRVSINLPEWGGVREVEATSECYRAFCLQSLRVSGSIGRDDGSTWSPQSQMNITDFRSSGRGTFLLNSDSPEHPLDVPDKDISTWYRVVDGGLVPACVVRRVLVRPPGYASAP